jgi:hypothetical protein
MKHKMRKILTLIMVLLTIFSTATVTAFATDGTATGTGEVTATVPVEGTISALTISVTHPVTLAYTVDPNAGTAGEFIAPDIAITNNTKVPVNITVQSLASSLGGTLQFTDVASDAKDWANLTLNDSKTFIALGVKAKDATGWNTGYEEGVHYAVTAEPTLFGSLPANEVGTLTMVANFGLAFDQSYTAKHNLVFMFNLV